MNNVKQYKELIATSLNADCNAVFLYWKGRVALFAILKAMGVTVGDEVILPAFTCVVVPNAIKYLGAKPIYVDIDKTTYNANVTEIESKITPKTKVIICQNTFGLSSHVEELVTLARERGLFTVEDCTHGFGGTYNSKPNGSYCDAAFYSTQWNKPFSTGVGGFAYIANEEIRNKLLTVNQELILPTVKDSISLLSLYFVRDKILNDKLYWGMVKLYRFLSKHKFVQGSSSGEEISSVNMPDNYFKAMSETQVKKGLKTIKNLDNMMDLRKRNAKIYSDYLSGKGKTYVGYDLFENHSFLKYPILVKNRELVLSLAEENKIPLGEWFCSPIHPIMEKFELWNICPTDFPIANEVSSQMLDLPTDTENIDRVIAFLNKINDKIL